MILEGTRVHAPALHRVAVLALRAELALVEIRVTVRATRTGVGKNFRHVAKITGDILVHAAQLKSSFRVVTEFRLGTQWRPTRGGMAVLTRKRESPMRVGGIHLR